MIKAENLLVSITTTKGSDWREKFRETSELGITECALFPTTLAKTERKEFFSLLEKSAIKRCPFVHLRSDMKGKEIEYLIEKFGTKVFNTHCNAEYPHVNDWSKYSKLIYIENIYHEFDPLEMKNWAGICLDLSHLENDRKLNPERFKSVCRSLKNYPVGCNHISGIVQNLRVNSDGEKRYDTHHFSSLADFDYLKNIPRDFFSQYCALEVDNTLAQQLEAKEYILSQFNKPELKPKTQK
jgi:hypothetical protein